MEWLKFWFYSVKAALLIPKLAKAEKAKNKGEMMRLLHQMQSLIDKKVRVLIAKDILRKGA